MIVLSFYTSGRDKRTEIKRSCGPDGRPGRKMKPIYVNDRGCVKVYQLDFKVKNCKTLAGTIAERELSKTRLNEQWVIDEDVSESIDKIAVSDAHTHAERLVFPAFWIKNTITGERKVCWTLDQIAGNWTMMIFGGDSESMLEPEEYIAQLREINK